MSCYHAINGRTWGFIFFLDRLTFTLDFVSFCLFLRIRSHDFLTGNWHDKIISIYLYSTEKKHTSKKNQGSERKEKKRGSVHSLHSIPIYPRFCDVNKSGLWADTGLNKSTTTPTAPPSRANIAFVSLFWCGKFIHFMTLFRKIFLFS